MTNEMIHRFTSLVYFLGNVLGPDYEITLYDLEADTQSVIAIANGRISGQTFGSPLPEVARELLTQKQYEQDDYVLNFTNHLQATGKTIRSSAMFIKDDAGKPVGLLGINFDDSRFLSLSNALLDLIHPRGFLQQEHFGIDFSSTQMPFAMNTTSGKDTVHNDVNSLIQEIFLDTADELSAPLDRLTPDERIAFITKLKEKGMFRLKGAVQYAAEKLACSQASIYRYLSKAKFSKEESEYLLHSKNRH